MTDKEALEMEIERRAYLMTADQFCTNEIIVNDEGYRNMLAFIDSLREKAKSLEIKLKQDGRLK